MVARQPTSIKASRSERSLLMGTPANLVKDFPPYMLIILLSILGLLYRFAGALVDEAVKDTWQRIKKWNRTPPRL
jgi:hypothetical protein